jgi:hypothetical protein
MKTKLQLLAAFLLTAGIARAADVTLSWDPSPDPVASYRIYYRLGDNSNGPWTVGAVVPGTSSSLVHTNLGVGVHHWYATSVNEAGIESDPSNEVSYTISKPRPPTMKPVELRMAMADPGSPPLWASLEQGLTLASGPWTPVYRWSLVRSDYAFFRILIE